MKKQILALTMLLASTVSMAQKDSITIGGIVKDATTGIVLPGVMVEAYGNERLTAMTNEKGHYSLKLPAYVSSVCMKVDGYNLQQIAIGRQYDKVDGKLYPSVFRSQYTRQTKATVTDIASSIDNTSHESVDPLISESLGASVRSISRGGNVGVGNAMFMAGLNSLQSNAQPLIIVDGIIMDMQYGRTMLHDGYYNNILANINVNDIENVTVLKNGTAIYGAKGANGVILINTKRNKSMATKIDVTINGRFENIPRLPSMLDAEDYRLYATELLGDQTANVSGLGFLNTDPTYYYYKKYHNATDWTKQVYQNSFSSNYGINVQGGDDVASYNLSVGYAYANSTLKQNDFTRFDMRLNTDISVFKGFNVRFDASYSDVTRSLFDDGVTEDVTESTITSPGLLGLIKAPFLSPYAYDINGNLSSYYSEADDYLSDVYGSDAFLANPCSILKYGDGKNRNHFGNRLIMMTITPKYDFNEHLSLSDQFNFSLINTDENYYLPLTGVPSFKVKGMSNNLYVNNLAESLAGRENSIQNDFRLHWNNRYGLHAFNVLAGLRYLSQNYQMTLQRGYNSSNDKTPNMSTSLSYKTTSGADDKSRDVTWYVNGDYNLAEKYYFTAGLSAEASSRFGKDADGLKMFGVVWGLFPSAQAGWVVSNETWMSPVKAVNYLRLNVGYDVTGNDDIDYTASRTYFVANRMLDNSLDGLSIENIGNNTLSWESTRRLTAGVEGNFFNNILNLKFHVFSSHTSNLLTLRELAYTSGLSETWANDGDLKNTGYDGSFNLKLLRLKNWQWEAGVSVGHYKNKITSLPNDNASIETTVYGADILSQVGLPVGVFYGYKTEGVFATEAEAKNADLYIVDNSGTKEYFSAGDMHFVDTNGDHCINEKDKVVIGDPNPDIYGNIYSSLTWRHWNLSAMFNYSLGNDIYNYQRSVLESGSYFFNQTTAMSNRWTTEGQETAIPRIEYGDPMGNSRFSDRWIEDGSYLRLKSLTLSYSLPMNFMFLKGITVWGAAYNLFTITHYLGSDPDCSLGNSVLSQGIDRGLLGNGRSFSIGMKLNL